MATASTFVNVFSGVLLDSLDKLREEDDVGLLERLPDLIVSYHMSAVDSQTSMIYLHLCFSRLD